MFLDSIQDLIDSLESKINLWYVDDGNLDADYRTPSKDLKKMLKQKKRWDSKLNPTKYEIFYLGDITEKRRSTILVSFQKIGPGIRTATKEVLIIFCSPLGTNSQSDLLEKKIIGLEKGNRIVEKAEKLVAQYVYCC